MNLAEEEEVVNALSRDLQMAERIAGEEENHLLEADLKLNRAQDAQEILQRLAQAVQQQAHARISKVVSSCLQVVFGDEAYEFHIEFERKRGKTEALLRFKRDELDVDPLTASGGGMVDVAAFALRVACLVLHRPRLSKLVVADEPFRFVSTQYRENVKLMLEGLAEDMGIQIVMVTHSEELRAGKIIEV